MTSDLSQMEIEMLKLCEPTQDPRFTTATRVVRGRTETYRVWTDFGLDPIRQIILNTKDKGISHETLITKAAVIGIQDGDLWGTHLRYDGIMNQLINQGEVARIKTATYPEIRYKYVATPKMKIPSGGKPSTNRTTSKTNTSELVEVLWAIESHLAVIASALKKVN